ncbi:MAG: glycyl-radical enzyme activating protein [Bacteroidales bacterium]|nr:glycyl-radical enzyme activating protein [Bacteroidales bacterium]MBS3774402.1 glycyl-radical enzyme activating protein [Bacteroidales bacterium]
MKGLIFDIKHYAIHDGPGIRQTVFFKGCPLSCWWCHNPESQSTNIEYYIRKTKLEDKTFKRKQAIGYYIDSEELLKTIEGDRIFYEDSGGGVTFSGGEPLMQPDFLNEVTAKCKEADIHTALDTSGFSDQGTLIEVLPNIDLILFDLKLIDNELHKKYTGVPSHLILENLEFLNDTGRNMYIRFPIIPGITNTSTNLEQIKSYLTKLNKVRRIDILPYYDISKGKYKRFNKENKMGEQKLQDGEPERIQEEFESLGFEVKIGG